MLLAFAMLGCQSQPRLEALPPDEEPSVPISPEVYRRADLERTQRLEAEVERLRADLRQAEEVLVAIESGLRGEHSHAEAASSLAEARIQVERAARQAPWLTSEIHEARRRLEDADAQIQQSNFGAAVVFVFSARRIARNLQHEAKQLASSPAARLVRAGRVNLRGGPSTEDAVIVVLNGGTPVFTEGSEREWTLVRTTHGRIGWIHSALLAQP